MLRLAFRSVRARALSYLSSAVVVLAGTALLTAFGAVLETGLHTNGPDRRTLVLLPLILGGWTLAIVTYGIVSTVALSIRQRDRETALLRTVAATPAQVRAALVTEVLLVALPAVLPGLLVGRGVLAALVGFGAVGPVAARTGGWSVAAGTGAALVAAAVAAVLASRRAARIPPVRALAGADDAPAGAHLGRPRAAAGAVLLGLGVGLGVTTLFMPNGPLLSSTAGPGGVAAAIGLALLAPAAAGAVRALAAVTGGAVRLGVRSMSVRAAATAAVVGPLVLLVGIAAGTLAMQRTEDGRHVVDTDAARIAPVNYLVVVMITGFALIAAGNALVAATRHRNAEFVLLHRIGATRAQLLRMVGAESAVTALVAVLLGTVAVLVMVVPFSIVRTGAPLPAGGPWIWLGVAAGTVAVTTGIAVGTAARLTRAAA
ncbi:FtsX-like permease family protein [Actinocatenispora rupis]|uniref:ABC3 transporter permease C-terminal domain-containing protein n=1 Tax=Actinocatenispora rupis TaxID=519421 RepID=A0A8J3J4C9_9ACTN|nr:FtsX-like permease family protein [Actinocatenispora rupis]GID09912.1 hypothetical protein Aru02nite_08010 [Actinocatenispora rupis]